MAEKDKKLVLFSLALVGAAAILPPLTNSTADDPRKVAEWFTALPTAKEKTTHLHFYFHDTLSGKNPTSVRIVDPPEKQATLFGFVNMADDLLTAGFGRDSETVGRAQGFYGSAGLESFGLLMNLNFVFTGKKFNGSTLTLLGRNPVFETYREMSIVGGSGGFRLARGVATAKTVFINFTSGDAVVEYHVVVLHY